MFRREVKACVAQRQGPATRTHDNALGADVPIARRQDLIDATEHLVRLGSGRVLAEILTETARSPGGIPALLDRLNDYRRLDLGTLRALGADRWPRPLRPSQEAPGRLKR